MTVRQCLTVGLFVTILWASGAAHAYPSVAPNWACHRHPDFLAELTSGFDDGCPTQVVDGDEVSFVNNGGNRVGVEIVHQQFPSPIFWACLPPSDILGSPGASWHATPMFNHGDAVEVFWYDECIHDPAHLEKTNFICGTFGADRTDPSTC